MCVYVLVVECLVRCLKGGQINETMAPSAMRVFYLLCVCVRSRLDLRAKLESFVAILSLACQLTTTMLTLLTCAPLRLCACVAATAYKSCATKNASDASIAADILQRAHTMETILICPTTVCKQSFKFVRIVEQQQQQLP